MTTLIISNEELNDIMKIVKSLVSETVKNEAEEQKGGFIGMLLGTLSASLLRNLSTGRGTIRAGEHTIRAGQGYQQVEAQLEQVNTQLEQDRAFNAGSSFNKF